MAPDADTHSPYFLSRPEGWVLYVSHSPRGVRRLVVFVHGFLGGATATWRDFPSGARSREWWQDADLLFVGYESTRDNITAVAHRLRNALPNFYPVPFANAMIVDGNPAREDVQSEYTELILLGHSLGGVILRRALADVAEVCEQGPADANSKLLDAKMRLFSPASAGFRAAGILGVLRATTKWAAIEMFIRKASAYTDLQPGSPTLEATQKRTELLAANPRYRALKAQIIWANPENVVSPERYETDLVDDAWDDTSHLSVCKPKLNSFEEPWKFAETGETK